MRSGARLETSSAIVAEFAAGLRFQDIPEDVVAHAKLCLLDTLGCGLFGSTLPWTKITLETLLELDGSSSVGVWGTPHRLAATHAVLVNGTAVHAFELDDLHARSIVHPGSVVAPPAIAAVIERGGSGADVIVALVAGYEVAARVGASMGAAHLLAGWHPTGTHGAVGAAAAAGSGLGLEPDQLRNALGVAGSMASGLMSAQYESMVKRLHAGHAAQSGLFAALLARRGFLGIADLFEAEYGGYGKTFSPSFDPTVLTDSLAESWYLRDVGFKPYACNGSCHPTIDSLRSLRDATGVTASDVERVDIFASSATVKHVGWPYRPGSVTTAQMNLPYIVAVVLTDGDAFVDQFTPERIVDPQLVELSQRVDVHVDSQIDAEGDAARHATAVRVTLRDGRILTDFRRHAKGSARDPLSRHEVEVKFRRLAGKVLTQRRVEQLASIVDRLDEVDHVDELATTLGTPASPGP